MDDRSETELLLAKMRELVPECDDVFDHRLDAFLGTLSLFKAEFEWRLNQERHKELVENATMIQ